MSDLVPPMMPEQLDALIQTMERVQQLEAELAKLRLTDDEREAIERLCEAVTEYAADDRKTNGETFAAGDEQAVAIVRRWLAKETR